MHTLSSPARTAILVAAFVSMLFDGVELGLMPIASLSVSKSLLAEAYTDQAGRAWFARFAAALMLGAAIGGIWLGNAGDRWGRKRALGVSMLFYSLFAGLGAFVSTPEQMLLLRFLVGLGVGGVWPNAVALTSECWPNRSRPIIAGLLGAALNLGILLLSRFAFFWPVTEDSWRWLFQLATLPALVAIAILFWLPESPLWEATASKGPAGSVVRQSRKGPSPFVQLFQPDLVRITLLGIFLGTIPLVGAWSASKWMIPWAEEVSGKTEPSYKASAQGWWAIGAVLGSFSGAQLAATLGRRFSYGAISLGATAITLVMFRATAPQEPWFLPIVMLQGFVGTLFFGWLPLYLPELFPTQVRAVGSGLSYNIGRFATAGGVLASGMLFSVLGGNYPLVGSICAMIYLFGIFLTPLIPDRKELS